LWIDLFGLEIELVMVELTITLNVDGTGGIVRNSTPSISTALRSILVIRLEIEGVMVELTILLSVDLMGGDFEGGCDDYYVNN
jgi:hypothetical protein